MRASLTILLLLVVVGAWWALAGPSAALLPTAAAPTTGGGPEATAAGEPGAAATDGHAPRDDDGPAREVAVARACGRLQLAGAPLADADVLCCTGRTWQAQVVVRTRTAVDGRFELPAPPKGAWLAVVHEAAPVGWCSGVLTDKSDLGVFDVPVPGVVVGRVRDEAGNAVPGAEVVCEISSYAFARIDGEPRLPTAVADREGAFRLQRIPPGEQKLRGDSIDFAVVANHAVEVVAGGEVATEITLQRGVLLNGLVLDWRGKPLAGAAVRAAHGRTTETDALGRFTFAHFRRGTDLRVTAPGHLDGELQSVYDVDQVVTAQLERAVTLRGVVHGTGGKPGTLRIEPRESARPDASHTMPYRVVYEDLDVVRDGRFEVGGMSCAAFDLIVTVPGVGKVGPVRVEVDGDTEVEMTLVPAQQVSVVLRDEQGAPIEAAKLAVDPGAQKYPSLYLPGEGLAAKILKKVTPLPIDAPGGGYTLAHPRGEGLAFAVLVDGCLPAAQSFPAGEVPDRIEMTMIRAGALRGVVVGGERAAYGAQFEFWPAGVDHAPRPDPQYPERSGDASRPWPRAATVKDDGTFAAERIPAGDYRGAVARTNQRNARVDSTGVPIVDGGADRRVEVAFSVAAGATADVEIAEAPLGVLRGRVLVRGVPSAGVAVMASRESASSGARVYGGLFDQNDWDNELKWQFTAGQLSDADGGFEIRYREAGPLELRVRHAEGHATSSPLVVDLPPPGAEVVRDLHVPVGEIRGRFPLAAVPSDAHPDYRVTLFPLAKAGDDAFYSAGDYSAPIAWNCAHFEGPADGAFAFSYLSPGQWVVRVSTGVFGGALLWQQVVEVQHGVVDLGEIAPKRRPIELSWQWTGGGKPEAEVLGLWLWRLVGDPPQRVWAETMRGGSPRSEVLEPGRYEVQPFGASQWYGWRSLNGVGGPAIAAPVSITITADGKVEPAVMRFVPLPKEEGK
ncbi:MAG: carboxypeptidase regulatory-like domain-containing protein [Planctomycetes bacterium]|nr:carboxypeptidase regulatory-like domain-containing protein [Planctomycetota bacterium]